MSTLRKNNKLPASKSLDELLKQYDIRPFVSRTTRRTVGSYPKGLQLPMIKTPAPTYLFKVAFDPNFDKGHNAMMDNIDRVKALIAYEKLRDRNKTFTGSFVPTN